MIGAGSEPIGVPVICQKDKLTKLKKQLPRRKSMNNFNEAVSKVILNLFHCQSMLHQILLQQ